MVIGLSPWWAITAAALAVRRRATFKRPTECSGQPVAYRRRPSWS